MDQLTEMKVNLFVLIKFQLEREGVGAHMAFGSGAHHCPGALLGRQEMIRSFKFLIKRLKNIKLDKPLQSLSIISVCFLCLCENFIFHSISDNQELSLISWILTTSTWW